ncbi:hypothetical protein B0H13DRAFT_2328482 [Mycena leptocephala]|nr:hypothetical protein B0H13DRAFT_2328482 [Mycena leptocephala]
MIRELGITVALCYLIARSPEMHLAVFGPPATCGAQSGSDFLGYRVPAAQENLSPADVLKVTTDCSIAAFGAPELCMLLARRAGKPCEVEDVGCRERNVVSKLLHPIPEKQLEKQRVFRLFSLNLALSESQVLIWGLRREISRRRSAPRPNLRITIGALALTR